MNNIPITIENKKLNLYQKIRLKLFTRKREITFEDYMRAPEYIKRDTQVIRKVVRQNDLAEEQLLQLPEYELMKILGHNKEFIQKFSVIQQAKWIDKGYVSLSIYDKEERNKLLSNLLQNGRTAAMKILKGQFIYEKEFLEHLKGEGILEEYLPKVIPELSESTKREVLKHKPDLLNILEEDEQIQIFMQTPTMFQYASIDIQLRYMEDNPKYFKNASMEAKQSFIKEDDRNIEKLDTESQVEMVTTNPNLFPYISNGSKNEIFYGYKPKNITIANLLRHDLNNSRNLKFIDRKPYIANDMNEIIFHLFERVEELKDDDIINMILHSKVFSAIGTLTPASYSFHSIDGGNGQEEISGIDGYCNAQMQVIKTLSVAQVSKLISIDSNYILPYLGFLNEHGRCILTEEERQISKARCEELFSNIYGKNKLEQFRQSINTIFDMQMEKNEKISKIYLMDRRKIDNLLKQGEIPLEEFKILFNERIIDTNSYEIIEQYLKEKAEGKDEKELFKEIITNAYGQKARAILESRPDLDVHSINSLEIFDERILEDYGEAFVHDCISYNIRDFSEFLEVVKNPNKRELFKTYYDILVAIYGKNVETMQKAISEYSYLEELLKKIESVELTDTQYKNLISVFDSRRNPININTLEDLQNYEEIANKHLVNQMEDCIQHIRAGRANTDSLKELISENFLGLKYNTSLSINYGDTVDYITSLYDIQGEELKEEIYTEEEKKILNVLDFLKNEQSAGKLEQLANLLMQERGIRNPIVLHSALQKTKINQTEILNDSLSSISKLEELCEKEKNTDSPSIYMEQEDGLKIYHLNGIHFTFLTHDSFAGNDNIIRYEGQAGNTAICTRVVNQSKGIIDKKFLYTHIDDDMLISSSKKDALTTHVAKRVKNKGFIDTKAKDISNLANIAAGKNEVAFYRRYRNHDKVNNKNSGGRRFPDAYGIGNIKFLDEKTKEFCRKYNIPIVVMHAEKYKDRQQSHEDEREK